MHDRSSQKTCCIFLQELSASTGKHAPRLTSSGCQRLAISFDVEHHKKRIQRFLTVRRAAFDGFCQLYRDQPVSDLSVRPSVRPRPSASVRVRLSVCLGPQRYGVEVCMATTTTTILTMTHWTEDRFASKVAASELEYLERCEKKNRKNVGVQHELLIDCQQAHPLSWIFNVWASDTAKIVVWLPSLSPTIGEMTARSLSLPVCLQSPRCRCQEEDL